MAYENPSRDDEHLTGFSQHPHHPETSNFLAQDSSYLPNVAYDNRQSKLDVGYPACVSQDGSLASNTQLLSLNVDAGYNNTNAGVFPGSRVYGATGGSNWSGVPSPSVPGDSYHPYSYEDSSVICRDYAGSSSMCSETRNGSNETGPRWGVPDYSTSRDGGQRETAQGRGSGMTAPEITGNEYSVAVSQEEEWSRQSGGLCTSIPPNSNQEVWNNTGPFNQSWDHFLKLGQQSRSDRGYGDPPTVSNNRLSVDASTPSETSYEGYWASEATTAKTSQTSFNPEYQGFMGSHSTLRPPSRKDGRSPSPRRRSRPSLNSAASHPYASGPRSAVECTSSRGMSLSRSSSARQSATQRSGSPCTPISPSPTDADGEVSEGHHVCDCGISFTGLYGKSNLHRHQRLKKCHVEGQDEQQYECKAAGCSKRYKRQDARVKHYRKHHPELAPGPVLPRPPYQ
ncbi:hypothetical protein BDW02DRAFT_577023 [Decorospora gaudefroyi]|uniref:C2H2-type domain-containing protein n=1 Tax=Decorospora gaudefroyi TaxID=184978 RepID=A0A6A5KR74_9PLEO|nr:hypothetical protein BDW02DRAFT_577023 [Decorospora gaudefroyi]